MTNETKECPACGKIVKGRADKKFCNDNCRNNYNNLLNSDTSNYVRNVNNILRRNRRILEEILKEAGKATSRHKADLLKQGFRFEFFTSSYTNPDNKTYHFCYEYGYTLLEKDKYLLVRNTLKELLEPANSNN